MKIYTITCHNCYNFGASLQTFALQHFLIGNTGSECKVIHYVPYYMDYSIRYKRIPEKYKFLPKKIIWCLYHHFLLSLFHFRKKKFDYFLENFISHTKKMNNFNDLVQHFENCNENTVFICGSDQIWNGITYENGKDPAFFLKFARKGVKISYAASFGASKVSQETVDLIPCIKYFDHVSVREASGIEILKSYGISSDLVVDPVFLLDKKEWDDLVSYSKLKVRDYILVYGLDNISLLESLVKKNFLGEKVIVIGEMGFKIKNGKFFKEAGPIDFLFLIKNAKFIITNSFHCIAFSVIFEKKFMYVKREIGINERIDNLINLCGMGSEVFSADINKKMDFLSYKLKLKDKIDYSISFLMKGLTKNEK